MARGSGNGRRRRTFSLHWGAPPPTSSRTSTVCAPPSTKRVFGSCTSQSPARAIGRGTRRRSPPTLSATALPTPSPTRNGSATDAHCLTAATRSASHSSFFRGDLGVGPEEVVQLVEASDGWLVAE